MELSSCLMFPLSFLLLICCHLNSAEESPDHNQQFDFNNLANQDYDNFYGGHSFGGRLGYYGIPFRPVRRIGSEFLGKRSLEMSDFDSDPFSLSKRAKARMGSEFLGKRRLGSEFLGKRSPHQMENVVDGLPWELDSSAEPPFFYNPILLRSSSPSSNGPQRAPEKRARGMGSEFLGKRRSGGPYDWSWKRARLGSEFLGKRDGSSKTN